MVYLIGMMGGFFSGFFGAGGGLLILPALIHWMKMDVTKARGTTLISVFVAVLIASIIYSKNRYFDLTLAVPLAIGGTLGGWIGAKLVLKIPHQLLGFMFDFFLIYTAFKMFFSS